MAESSATTIDNVEAASPESGSDIGEDLFGEEEEARLSTSTQQIGVAVFGFSPFAACALRHIIFSSRLASQIDNIASPTSRNNTNVYNNNNKPRKRSLRLIGCWTADESERAAFEAFLKQDAEGIAKDADIEAVGEDFAVLVGGDPAVLAGRDDVALLLLCCRCQRVQTGLAKLANETGILAIRLSPPPPPPHRVPETVAVGCSYRYLASVQCMRSRLAGGLIGRLQVVNITLRCPRLVGSRYDWTCDPDMGGGVLAYNGALAIDLVHYLLPAAATNASADLAKKGSSAIGSNSGCGIIRASGHLLTCQPYSDQIEGIRRICVDQVASFDLQLTGDCWVHVWLDSLYNGHSHTIELIGELGRLTLADFVLTHAAHSDDAESVQILHSDPITEAEQRTLKSITESAGMPMKQLASPALVKCAAGLIDSVAMHESIDYPAGSYWAQVQQTLTAIRCSSQLRRWVSLAECVSFSGGSGDGGISRTKLPTA